MATTLAPFDTYMIFYTARRESNSNAPASFISCYEQGTEVAQLQFFSEILPSSPGGGLAAGGEVVLYYQLQQFQDVLAILQREGPLAVWFDDVEKYGYILTTSEEPVGELEHPVQLLVPKP
jgi:hypothetical protein